MSRFDALDEAFACCYLSCVRIVLILVLSGCGAVAGTHDSKPVKRPGSCGNSDVRPVGTADQYRPPHVSDVTIDSPVACENHSAYIRVARETGVRQLGTERAPNGAFNQGCMSVPSEPANPDQCATINAIAILNTAAVELRAEGIEAIGVGAGPCADMRGDYDDWRVAITISNWKHAARSVRIVAGQLQKYDIRGHVGVGIAGVPCRHPLASPTE